MIPVVAQTAYPAVAPGSRVRVRDFGPHLLERGVDLRFQATMSDDEYSLVTSDAPAGRKMSVLTTAGLRLMRQRKIDSEIIFLVHRLRFLLPLPGIDPPPRIDIYDFDDSLFVGSVMDENRRFALLKREAARWRACVSRARLVLAGNPYLADHARQFARRVEVVPTCVDPDLQPTRTHGETELVRVGWIGSKSTTEYLNACLPALEKFNRDRHRVQLVLIGAGTGFDAPWIESHPWSPSTERDLLASLDVGIMPLPDDEWARGKCGYKLLQYFAAGVPAIASPVGINRSLVGTERGVLASDDDGWLKGLELLVSDAQVRAEMGSNARTFVENHYSYAHWAPRLADLVRGL